MLLTDSSKFVSTHKMDYFNVMTSHLPTHMVTLYVMEEQETVTLQLNVVIKVDSRLT